MGSIRALATTLRKKLRQGYVRLLRSPGAPRQVAGGMALGLFVSMMPVLQMPVALLLVEVLRRACGVRLSRVAALSGVWLTNPVTAAGLYGIAWFVGKPVVRLLLPSVALDMPMPGLSLAELGAAGPFALQIALCLGVGGVLVGIPIAVFGYHLTLRAVERYQARRASRRLRLRPAAAA
ncbi:DUF2062 domain-containing protein [Vulgatibacter sp.]|uniref:DUF2062 domain-containing protein n=1 Tax=Vulgatibacter sp. TaxID=1971226 RepID=UPI00356A4B3F